MASLFEILEASYKDSRRAQLWWRGQPQDWPLVAAVYRVTDRGPYERGVVHHFRGEAPSRCPGCPPLHDLVGWLFLMQHHGVPTRLMDWSASPLIALLFAVRETESDDHPGALFALDPWTLNRVSTGVEGTIASYELGPVFEAAYSIHPAEAKWHRAFAITTEESNPGWWFSRGASPFMAVLKRSGITQTMLSSSVRS